VGTAALDSTLSGAIGKLAPVTYDGTYWSLDGKNSVADLVAARLSVALFENTVSASPYDATGTFLRTNNGAFVVDNWDGMSQTTIMTLTPTAAAFPSTITSNGTAVCLTNDTRLTNQRTPLDGSVTDAKLADAKLSLASGGIVTGVTRFQGTVASTPAGGVTIGGGSTSDAVIEIIGASTSTNSFIDFGLGVEQLCGHDPHGEWRHHTGQRHELQQFADVQRRPHSGVRTASEFRRNFVQPAPNGHLRDHLAVVVCSE